MLKELQCENKTNPVLHHQLFHQKALWGFLSVEHIKNHYEYI